MAQFRATMEKLQFCEVWTNDRYGLIKNATRKDSEGKEWCLGIILELSKYWDKFQTLSSIFGLALRLTYTGSYRIIQRYFSERISRLRVFFENVQQWLFIRLVWRPDDISHVYGSFESLNFKFEACTVKLSGTRPLPLLSQPWGWLLSILESPLIPYTHISLPLQALFSLLPLMVVYHLITTTGGKPPPPDLPHL